MKAFIGLALLFFVASCNDANTNKEDNTDSIEETDPAIMQPPADALPDSVKLINDSIIIRDSTAGSLKGGTMYDSL